MKKVKLIGLLFLCSFSILKAQSFEDGIKAMDAENYATAKGIFTKLIQQQPLESKNYYYLGVVFSIVTNIDSARIIFNKGTEVDPKAYSNFIGLGRTYLDQNNQQKAQEYFDKAKSLTSQKDINLYLYLADAYSASQYPNFEQAITLLNKAIELNNKVPEVYWVLGKTFEAMLNKSGDAVSAFERSTELNPAFAKSFTRIGVIWRKAQNYNLSLASFQNALKAIPDFPPALREEAELFYYTGQYEKAEETYQKYLTLADKGDDTKYRYAQFLFLTKKYQDALNILNELKSKNNNPIMFRLLGYSNYEMGNYQQGLDDINSFFSKTPSEKIIAADFEYRGKLLIKTGNDSTGVLDIEKAIMMDSTKYDLYNDIAKMQYDKKNYHNAAMGYKKKIEASKKNAVLVDYFNEGRSFFYANEFERADSSFINVIQMNPAWPIGDLWRAYIMQSLDKPVNDSIKGLAAPFYLSVIDKAYAADTIKYQKELFSAFKYMGDINALRTNYGASLYYYAKASAINATDPDVKATIDAVKKNYKGSSSGNSVAATKNEAGYILAVSINGIETSALYAPGITGVGVTQDGYTAISATSPISKTTVKIGERSAKNISIALMNDLKQPVAIGADVLNKMNIVFDYPSGALLFR